MKNNSQPLRFGGAKQNQNSFKNYWKKGEMGRQKFGSIYNKKNVQQAE